MGQILTNPGGGASDLSFITADASKILSPYVGANTEGEPINGSITTLTGSATLTGASNSTTITDKYVSSYSVTVPKYTGTYS